MVNIAVFIGPEHAEQDISAIASAIPNTGMVTSSSSSTPAPAPVMEVLLQGNGIDKITKVGIEDTLKKSTDGSHLHYWGHGNVKPNGEHIINIADSLETTLQLFNVRSDAPGVRHIWSCYAGAASLATIILLEDRPSILHCSKKHTSLESMNSDSIAGHIRFYHEVMQEQGHAPSGCDAFEYSMLTSPETITYCEYKDFDAHKFTARATKKPTGPDDLKIYLEAQVKDFREFRKTVLGHSEDMFLPMEKYLTPEVLNRYLEHAMIMEAGREHSKHGAEYVAAYLNAGVDPNCVLTSGITALAIAADVGNKDVVDILLADPRTNVHKWDINLMSPLHFACEKGHGHVVESLLKMGAAPEDSDKFGRSPFYLACSKGHTTVANQLLQHMGVLSPALVDLQDNSKKTPLYAACKNGHLEVVKILLNNHADVTIADESHVTPFQVACQNGHNDIVAHFLDRNKVNINQPNYGGSTPISIAADTGNLALAQLLLSKGAYVSVTTILVTARTAKPEVMELLLSQIRDVKDLKKLSSTEDSPISFLDHLRREGHTQIADKISNRIQELEAPSIDITTLRAQLSLKAQENIGKHGDDGYAEMANEVLKAVSGKAKDDIEKTAQAVLEIIYTNVAKGERSAQFLGSALKVAGYKVEYCANWKDALKAEVAAQVKKGQSQSGASRSY